MPRIYRTIRYLKKGDRFYFKTEGRKVVWEIVSTRPSIQDKRGRRYILVTDGNIKRRVIKSREVFYLRNIFKKIK